MKKEENLDNEKDISFTQDGHEILSTIEDNSFWFNHKAQSILCLAQKLQTDHFLDIGGGTGYIAKFLQDQNIHVTLMEPLSEGVILAKKRGVKQVIKGRINEAGDGLFDTFALLDVIEHIEDDIGFLQQVYAKMQKGNRLIITVPAYQFLWSSFDKNVGHFRRYNLKRLNETVKKSGFTPIYTSYYFSLLVVPVFLLRVLLKQFYAKKNQRKEKKIEHVAGNKTLSNLFLKVLSWEHFFLKRFWKIPFGTSCLMIVEKR